MSRGVLGLNRVVALLLGTILLAAGLAVALWSAGVFDSFSSVPSDSSGVSNVDDVVSASWWPWVSTLAGAALAALALLWLLAHLPHSGTGPVTLPGSNPSGTLRVDPKAVVSAAQEALEVDPSVRSARGGLRRERGHLVLDLQAKVEPDADLVSVGERVSTVLADAAVALGRPDLEARARIQVVRPGGRSGTPRLVR